MATNSAKTSKLALQLPLRRSSTAFTFLNTSPADERPFLIKSDEQLKALPDDSEDIQCANVISRYRDRPPCISSMCLADYAACYDMVFQKADQKGKRDLAIVQDEDQNDDDVEITETYDENSAKIQLSSGCFLRKRKKRKIMRSVRYNKRKDPEDHYRELLMLYMP